MLKKRPESAGVGERGWRALSGSSWRAIDSRLAQLGCEVCRTRWGRLHLAYSQRPMPPRLAVHWATSITLCAIRASLF